MKWKALKLMNTDSFFDFWDKSDPYLKFLKVRGDNSLIEAFRTDVIKDNLNPSWKSFQIQASRLHSENSSRFK
jgi:Ca2+-dependent lipid-binding protein